MTKLIDYYNGLNPILEDRERKRLLKKYNKWIREQPSIIDGNPITSTPHHVRTATNSGERIKPHDLWQVPLTIMQHIHAENEKHAEYKKLFLEKLPALHERFIEETSFKFA